MLSKPIVLSLCFALFFFQRTNAQTWQAGDRWGGSSSETIEALLPIAPQTYLFGGSFSGILQQGTQTWTARGAQDIYLAEYSPERGFTSRMVLGGSGADALTGIAVTPTGDLFLGGEYWQELYLPDGQRLESTRNPKALFAALLHPDGNVRWSKTLEGGSLKTLRSIAVASDGFYLAGFFSDTLFADSLTLIASGSTAAFLIKLDAGGKVIWGRQFGGTGDSRAMACTIVGDSMPVIAGIFNRQLLLDDTTFTANTRDWDIFLMALSPQGETLWSQKAGGVYDDEVYDLTSDVQGGLYLTGQFVGVLQLDPKLSIQSRDGNADAFLLKYNIQGTPLWAKTLPGQYIQTGIQLEVQNKQLALLGYFQGTLEWAGNTLQSPTTYNGFLALADTAGQETELIHLSGSSPVLPTVLTQDGLNSWLIGGVYQGTPQWGMLKLPAPAGAFDVFLAQWGTTVNTLDASMERINIEVYPNPAQEGFWIRVQADEPPEVRLITLLGQPVTHWSNASYIATTELSSGLYILQIRVNGMQTVRTLYIQR